MVINGYINRYKSTDAICLAGERQVIPTTHNKINLASLCGARKTITYDNVNGMDRRAVYIADTKTNNKLTHVYSVFLPSNSKASVVVNLRGVDILTGKHATALKDLAFNAALNLSDDSDGLQLSAMSCRNDSTDTEDYLTTLDNSNYDDFISNLCAYIDVNKDLETLYDSYRQNVGFVSKGDFMNFPRDIYDALRIWEVVNESRHLINLFAESTSNGIRFPKGYSKYDNRTRRLVDDGYALRNDCSSRFAINCKHIESDAYVPILRFNSDLIDWCYSLIKMANVEDNRKYILSKCNDLRIRKISAYLTIVYAGCHKSRPVWTNIHKTITEEVFIDIHLDDDSVHKYYIDLTLIPLICHGLRYNVINEELT